MIAIGVVGHVHRDPYTLADQIGADAVAVDDGTLGSGGNHLRLLEMMRAASSAWTVVLEDDAVPVAGFCDQLQMALEAAPSPIVGLYFQRNYPPAMGQPLNRATREADHIGAHWITGPQLWGVGYALRGDVVDELLDDLQHAEHIDAAISEWAIQRGHRIALTWPSLVDHLDGPSLITERVGTSARGPRRAWRVGTRDHWTADAVEIA